MNDRSHRRRWLAAPLLACLPLWAASPAAAPDLDAAAEAVARASGAALQADMRRALRELDAAADAPWSPAPAAFRRCLQQRFADPMPAAPAVTDDPWLAALVRAYQGYWHRALLAPEARAAAEAELLAALAALLTEGAPAAAAPMDAAALDRRLHAALGARGIHALTGRTGALLELMLWREQRREDIEVTLPEGRQATTVFQLAQFVLLGWSDYATCGRHGTAGWATREGLFAVLPRYADPKGEEFRVSFLGHEAQHHADLATWGELPSWRLEYRAKLVELAQARSTLAQLLATFSVHQSPDPAQAHGHANLRVMQTLAAALEAADPAALARLPAERLNAAAAAALQEDSRQLAAQRSTPFRRSPP